jgi:hypothetical protein
VGDQLAVTDHQHVVEVEEVLDRFEVLEIRATVGGVPVGKLVAGRDRPVGGDAQRDRDLLAGGILVAGIAVDDPDRRDLARRGIVGALEGDAGDVAVQLAQVDPVDVGSPEDQRDPGRFQRGGDLVEGPTNPIVVEGLGRVAVDLRDDLPLGPTGRFD